MLANVERAMQDLINIHQKNPFEFLYESDLQGFLFMRLRDLVKTEVSIKTSNSDFKEKGTITTGVVHTEYGEARRLGPIDVAVIEILSTPDKGAKVNTETAWDQHVAIAIELKLCLLGYPIRDAVKKTGKDFEKLKKYAKRYEKVSSGKPFTGLAILFVQSCDNDKIQNVQRYMRTADWDGTVKPGVHQFLVTPNHKYRLLPKPVPN